MLLVLFMLKIFITATFCLIAYFSLQAQKVAVVFSGGGAKGLAHVGVLKALEENNIPVDYILGTSMGGVVAGAYAAGYSPDKIEYLVLNDDFLDWIYGNPEKGFNYHFYNKDDNASMISIKLSLDASFHAQFNTTIAKDLSLNFALAEKLAQPSATADYNFDSLFVPLRVVASEVFTQTTEVIESGTLNNAIRATLSVPFFYKPIKINDKYLFDGGIYNNFPIDVAKSEFNPDFIIGVNVSSKVFEEYPYEQDDELISNSLLLMLLDKSDPQQLQQNSIYIEPDVKDFTAFDFKQAKALIDSGYNATMAKMPELKEMVKARRDCEELVEKRNEFNNKNKPLLFSKVEVYDFTESQKVFIEKLFKPKDEKYITLEDIKKGYFRLMSEPYFQSIYPNITYDDASQSFIFELHGRPKNDLNVELGGNLSTRNISAMYVGGEFYYFSSLLMNTSFNFYGGNFYKSAQIKNRIYFPGLGHWYLEPELTYNYWDFLDIKDVLIENNESTILKRSDRKYGLNAALPLGQHYKLQISGAYLYNKDYYSNSSTFSIQDTLDFMNVSGLKTGVEVTRNTLNKKMFPTDGRLLRISGNRYDLTEDYNPGSTSPVETQVIKKHSWYKGEVQLEQFYKKGKLSTGYLIKGVVSNQPSFASEMGTLIYQPAFYPLIDSRTLLLQNFRSPTYLAAGLRGAIDFKEDFQFRMEGYAFKELGSIINKEESFTINPEPEPVHFAGSGTLIYSSPIGPVSLSLNYYDDRENSFGVLLNFGYLIFNKPSAE